ncbi:MAG TPA: PepSY domain-containing protein [Pelomicrobium sp.]|nr:PepSY domain-containing protein [Pelomicrobium sp.]
MHARRPFAWLLAAAMIAAATAWPAAARDAQFAPEYLLRVDKKDRDGRGKSARDEAAEKARRDTGGRVLSIKERPRDDREGYRVKILTPEGEVRYYDVDPNNGRGKR